MRRVLFWLISATLWLLLTLPVWAAITIVDVRYGVVLATLDPVPTAETLNGQIMQAIQLTRQKWEVRSYVGINDPSLDIDDITIDTPGAVWPGGLMADVTIMPTYIWMRVKLKRPRNVRVITP